MHESPTGGSLYPAITPRQKMLASYASPRKTRSLLVGTEKKNILDLGSGFSVGGVRKRVVLAFFSCFIMTSSPPQKAKILAQNLVVF